jgi:internalin A
MNLKLNAAIAVVLLASASVFACDDPNDKAKGAAAAPSASAAPVASSVPPVAPPAPPSAAPAPTWTKKMAADCKPHPSTIDFGSDGTTLEGQVRLKLSKAKGDITPADLGQVKSIDLTRTTGPLHQLDPCIFPMFSSLKFLYLGQGDYDDISPIAKLSTLEGLRLSLSRVKDLHNIEGLKSLDQLDLSHTLIGDPELKSVAGLVNVTELMLDDDNVGDLTPLSSLKKLQKLSIKNTLVKDLTPIASLKTLKILYIAGSAVSDISPVQPLMNGGMKLIQN